MKEQFPWGNRLKQMWQGIWCTWLPGSITALPAKVSCPQSPGHPAQGSAVTKVLGMVFSLTVVTVARRHSTSQRCWGLEHLGGTWVHVHVGHVCAHM